MLPHTGGPPSPSPPRPRWPLNPACCDLRPAATSPPPPSFSFAPFLPLLLHHAALHLPCTAASAFYLPSVSFIGAGALKMAAPKIQSMSFKKPLIVTDKGIRAAGLLEPVLATLKAEAGITEYAVFDDVKPNPTVSNVNSGLEVLRQNKCDSILSLGGGSPQDAAKGIAIVQTNGGKIEDYEGLDMAKKPQFPLIAVNTTAGTASEITRFAVITDEKRHVKMVITTDMCTPLIAVNDAELMFKQPKALTAATGMDALTHAVEAYAIRLIKKHLVTATFKGSDVEAREGMSYAEYLAGMAFNSAGLGYVHAMAHQMGAVYDLPHGVCNAILLPHVEDFNKTVAGGRLKDVAEAMGVDVSKMSDAQGADAAVAAIRKLSKEVEIPSGFKSLGAKESDLPKLADAALKDVCSLFNPREGTKDDIIQIYKNALIHIYFYPYFILFISTTPMKSYFYFFLERLPMSICSLSLPLLLHHAALHLPCTAASAFYLPSVSFIGAGALKMAAPKIQSMSFKKPLIVTDKGIRAAGLLEPVLATLKAEAGITEYAVFDDVKPNPTVSNVNSGLEVLRQNKCDSILSLGGGSPQDAAKGIAIVQTNGGKIEDYEGLDMAKKPQFPLIAVNTTAGTASEITRFAVITDEKRHVKMVITTDMCTPLIAVNDAELMFKQPKALTAATGMDALTHAVEAYAIRLIKKHLVTATFKGSDVEAREGMSYAEYLAGMAFNSAGLGYVHAMAHQMGADFNKTVAGGRLKDVAEAMGVDVSKMSDAQGADAAVAAIRKLSKEVEIPSGFKSLGAKESDLPKLADAALKDVCSLFNPREGTKDDIIQIYKNAL
eukprot:gene12167-8368_t